MAPFAAWLIEHRFDPTQASEWDDLLVEFKNDKLPTKAHFEQLVSSVEFLFPRFRGNMRWARAVITGWSVMHVPRHTVPLCTGPAHLVAVHMAALGHPKLGAGLLLQQQLGLRPSEVLNLERQDIALPQQAHALAGVAPTAIIGLGVRSGTKAKRAQSVILREPMMLALLAWLVSETKHGEPLIPYSYEQYRRLLKRITCSLHIDVSWTPHSARAGFASDATAAGRSFTDIREAGRWVADSSLRTYIDVVSAASISTNLRLAGFRPAILYAREHLFEFFPWARSHYAAQNVQGGFGRVDADLAARMGPDAGGLPRTEEPGGSEEDSNAPTNERTERRAAGQPDLAPAADPGRPDGRRAAQRGRGRGRH